METISLKWLMKENFWRKENLKFKLVKSQNDFLFFYKSKKKTSFKDFASRIFDSKKELSNQGTVERNDRTLVKNEDSIRESFSYVLFPQWNSQCKFYHWSYQHFPEIHGRLWDVRDSLRTESVGDKFKILVTNFSIARPENGIQRSTDDFGLLQTQRNHKPRDNFDPNHKWSMIISQSGTIWAPILSVICRWIVGINRAVTKKNLILSFIANLYRDPNFLRSRKNTFLLQVWF